MTRFPARKRWFAGVVVALALAAPAAQAAGTLTPIPSYADPNGVTAVLGINNAGWMTGSINYTDGSGLAFRRDAAGVYTTFSIDVFTQGRAIDELNNVSGYASDANGNIVTDVEFIQAPGGAVTLLQNPNDSSFLRGIAQGMNAAGAVVGDFIKSIGPTIRHGFVLQGSSFTELSLPGQPNARVAARAITDSGTVAGWAVNGGVTQGFVYTSGIYQFFSHPMAVTGTLFEDLNNNGVAAGEWGDAAGNFHAFLYNTTSGVITDIDVPGATNSQVFGINDQGEAVITTDLARGPNNFLYRPVPEPGTWAMLIVGVFGAGAMLSTLR